MGEVIPFPKTKKEPEKPEEPVGPVSTLIHQGHNVMAFTQGGSAVGHVPFPYPSADAVDPRYLKAVEEQRNK